jgi:hypothetical protein
MGFMNNKKLISYVGCGLLIVVVIYFILTVLKISGDTFKLNMREGFWDDKKEKTDPKLDMKKKTFEKATDKFLGDGESKGQIDTVINKRKKRLEELKSILSDDKEEIIDKLNILADIESKIQQHETIIAAVNVGKVAKSGIASKYVQQVVQYGLVEKYGELDM